MKKPLFSILILCVIAQLSGCNPRIVEHKDWKKIFDAYGVEGCFEVYDNNKEIANYYNKERCATRYTPASTFKIFNSLVALETGVATSESMIIKWDGVVRSNKNWNQDLTMAQAFKYSAVPYYQELARRIGKAKMQTYLDTVKYGNMKIGGAIDSFWLNNSLQISPDEQVGLLKRLYWSELPTFSDRSQRIVKNIMLQMEKPDYKLYYKTGTNFVNGEGIYWIVGFVETIHNLKNPKTKKIENIPHAYFFALNFSSKDTSKDWTSLRLEMLNKLLATLHLSFE